MSPRAGFLILLAAAGCAGVGMSLQDLNGFLARGEFAQAAARVESGKASYGTKNALLFELDKGLLLQGAGQYQESNASFEAAKRTAKDLFTKSVTAEASTFLINDAMRPYYGEDFERALIHVFCALNYALLGQTDEALVECRQVDFYLKTLRVDYGHKNAHTDDAFANYLGGLLYEDAGETNDAHISYLKALDAYEDYAKRYKTPRPAGLLEDALRTARILGFTDRVESLQKRWGDVPAPARPAGAGELIVLLFNGLAPQKVNSFFEISVFNGWPYVEQVKTSGEEDAQVEQARAAMRGVAADKMIRLAVPVYKPTPYTVRGMRVEAGDVQAEGSLVEDVGAIARQNLKDRIGRTRAKAVARAVVKYLIAQKVSEKVGEKKGAGAGRLFKAVLQAAAAATETADKRSWRTLPDQILMARAVLPAGPHQARVEFTDAAGAPVRTQALGDIRVKPGRRTFLIVRTAI